jgi:signal transduction histidine kinase
MKVPGTEDKPQQFHRLSNRILIKANKGLPRLEFFRQILQMIWEYAHYDFIGLWIEEQDKYVQCGIIGDRAFTVAIHPADNSPGNGLPLSEDDGLNRIRLNILSGKKRTTSYYTDFGSFWTEDLQGIPEFKNAFSKRQNKDDTRITNCRSLAIIPLDIGDKIAGLMEIGCLKPAQLDYEEIEHYENLARLLGIALANKRVQGALRERIKELTCLYNTAQIMENREQTIPDTLRAIVGHIPPAWQYPEITAARITLDEQVYCNTNFVLTDQVQQAPVIVNAVPRGMVEVVYLEDKPELDEGPFLREERKLVNALARQISGYLERKEAEEERLVLQEQLRHADRLATIGQLAAGVAHELNEPLGNILGFAQLAVKSEELPDQAGKDLQRIINASLQAREIIKKLMIFARQMPSKRLPLDLNSVIREGLYFFEMRCAKSGIDLQCRLSPDLPEVTGDQSQLNQVLVNLVVNALQAMPDGGKLNIRTYATEKKVHMRVEDTGHGMDDQTVKKIFIPFFTTKDVNEGTGLGLAVVHGIVTSHRGKITVSSQPGKGSEFEVILPVAGEEELP